MADVAVQHGIAGAYEPSLFGTYSKKIGMWLFLLSDSLTFGALLFAYSYGRISNPQWPTPFGKESILNATIMTACLLSSSLTMVLGVLAARRGDRSWTRNWILATMFFGSAFIVLHVTIGVIYLGVVALRKKFLPILLGIWLVAWLATPADNVFHIGVHVLLVGFVSQPRSWSLSPRITMLTT